MSIRPFTLAGTSATGEELLDHGRFPVHRSGRGGRYTYHGPGQRVIYVMKDLRAQGRDLRAYVCRLEEWVIRALGEFGIKGERRPGRIGIWIADRGREAKIAAIGVRVRRWIAYHGLSLNVNPDLTHYQGIVPCGLADFGVTSLQALGSRAKMADVDAALRQYVGILFET